MRIAIVGTSGSGKTTLARKLSTLLSCKHIELDAHAWKPGWVMKEKEVIIEYVREATKTSSWVTCGNYSMTRDVIWKEATHLVWLKLPARVVFWRLLKRTVGNILTKRELAGGNVESFYLQFFSKKSIFLWALKTHWKRKRTYPPLLASEDYKHLEVIVLKSQKEIDDWLENKFKDETVAKKDNP